MITPEDFEKQISKLRQELSRKELQISHLSRENAALKSSLKTAEEENEKRKLEVEEVVARLKKEKDEKNGMKMLKLIYFVICYICNFSFCKQLHFVNAIFMVLLCNHRIELIILFIHS